MRSISLKGIDRKVKHYCSRCDHDETCDEAARRKNIRVLCNEYMSRNSSQVDFVCSHADLRHFVKKWPKKARTNEELEKEYTEAYEEDRGSWQ